MWWLWVWALCIVEYCYFYKSNTFLTHCHFQWPRVTQTNPQAKSDLDLSSHLVTIHHQTKQPTWSTGQAATSVPICAVCAVAVQSASAKSSTWLCHVTQFIVYKLCNKHVSFQQRNVQTQHWPCLCMNAKPFITWIVMFLTVDSGNSFPLAHHHHHHHNRHHSGKTQWQVNKQIWSAPVCCNNNYNNTLTWIIFLQLPWQQCHLLITANRDIKKQ